MANFPALWIVLDASDEVVYSSTVEEQAITMLDEGDRLVEYRPVTHAKDPPTRRKRFLDPGPVVAELISSEVYARAIRNGMPPSGRHG